MDVKQIDAGDLNVGYIDAGPESGPAVLLLHGWPYDIHAYDEVTPMLVEEGCRVRVCCVGGKQPRFPMCCFDQMARASSVKIAVS